MYDSSSLGETICQCPPACKNLVWEIKHQNKYLNAKKKKKRNKKVITKRVEIEYITSKTEDGNVEF